MSLPGGKEGDESEPEAREETDSVNSPEYRTLRRAYLKVVAHVRIQKAVIWDALFSESYIPTNIHKYTLTDGISDEMKTRKVLDALLTKVISNPAAYHGFIRILKSDSTWGDDMVAVLDEFYVKECAASKPGDESQSTLSADNLGEQGREGILARCREIHMHARLQYTSDIVLHVIISWVS